MPVRSIHTEEPKQFRRHCPFLNLQGRNVEKNRAQTGYVRHIIVVSVEKNVNMTAVIVSDGWNGSVVGGELQDRLKHQSQPFEKNGSQGPHSSSVSLTEQRIEKENFQHQPVIACRALIIKTIVVGLPKNLFGKFILGENNPFLLIQGQADINESQ